MYMQISHCTVNYFEICLSTLFRLCQNYFAYKTYIEVIFSINPPPPFRIVYQRFFNILIPAISHFYIRIFTLKLPHHVNQWYYITIIFTRKYAAFVVDTWYTCNTYYMWWLLLYYSCNSYTCTTSVEHIKFTCFTHVIQLYRLHMY